MKSQRNRFAFISFGKIPCIWDLPLCRTVPTQKDWNKSLHFQENISQIEERFEWGDHVIFPEGWGGKLGILRIHGEEGEAAAAVPGGGGEPRHSHNPDAGGDLPVPASAHRHQPALVP